MGHALLVIDEPIAKDVPMQFFTWFLNIQKPSIHPETNYNTLRATQTSRKVRAEAIAPSRISSCYDEKTDRLTYQLG